VIAIKMRVMDEHERHRIQDNGRLHGLMP